MSAEHDDQQIHTVDYGVSVKVWACLLVLTGLTIFLAGLDLGGLSTLTAIFIASVKATLVLMFFMHLKYEPPVFITMSLVTVATLTVIILMTFSDVWFR
jgi:cytochrome c oxidase subunit 4